MDYNDSDFLDSMYDVGMRSTEDVDQLNSYIQEYEKTVKDMCYRRDHRFYGDTYKESSSIDWGRYSNRCYKNDNIVYYVVKTDGVRITYKIYRYDYVEHKYLLQDEHTATVRRNPRGRWYFRTHYDKKRIYLDDFTHKAILDELEHEQTDDGN